MSKKLALIFTCEHASNTLPPRYGSLGLRWRDFERHTAWDPGAVDLVRSLAARFCEHPYTGSYSRLLVDLNRGESHPDVIPAVSFGMPVPANAEIDDDERERRLETYHRPYRRAVARAARSHIDEGHFCLLLSVHSFTPILGRQVREQAAGVLFDEERPIEADLARAMLDSLHASHIDVRPNYPYPGTGTGVYSELRRKHPTGSYAGIEFETRLDELTTPRRVELYADAYEQAIHHAIEACGFCRYVDTSRP